MAKGQNIYHYSARVTWQKRRGSGYINMFMGDESRPFQFISRSDGIEQLNGNPEIILQVMGHLGLVGSKIYNFKFVEVYEQKLISESFYYKEKDE